ncbi:hypothetical protein Tco_0806792, partial [Tanacetum coccineum]
LDREYKLSEENERPLEKHLSDNDGIGLSHMLRTFIDSTREKGKRKEVLLLGSLLEGYELGVPNPAKINVLDAMNLAISALTMDVSSNTIANCFRHCKLRSTDNMTFENSDEGGESTQELQNLIKELGYRNAMDVEDVLTHPEENVVAQLLTDEEIIESVIGINKMISM